VRRRKWSWRRSRIRSALGTSARRSGSDIQSGRRGCPNVAEKATRTTPLASMQPGKRRTSGPAADPGDPKARVARAMPLEMRASCERCGAEPTLIASGGEQNACLRTKFPGCPATNGAINFPRPGTEVEQGPSPGEGYLWPEVPPFSTTRSGTRAASGRAARPPPVSLATWRPMTKWRVARPSPWDVQPVPLRNGRHDESVHVCR
jgi:hypothetical protein